MTTEQARKIRSSITDCDRYISKEEKMGSYLRPATVQERLDWTIEHRAKLQRALDTDSTAELFV